MMILTSHLHTNISRRESHLLAVIGTDVQGCVNSANADRETDDGSSALPGTRES